MRGRTRIIGIAALLLAVVAAITGWSIYSFEHAPILTDGELHDVQTAMKGELGKAVFADARAVGSGTEDRGLNALFASPAEPQGEGLIAAYKRDPQTFKRYAQLLDTAINAMKIADAVRHDRSRYQLPISSLAMPLKRSEVLDAWGHIYCVSSLKTAVVVVSGGPDAATFSCPQQKTRAREISSAVRSVFQASNGEVVVVSRQADGQGTPGTQSR